MLHVCYVSYILHPVCHFHMDRQVMTVMAAYYAKETSAPIKVSDYHPIYIYTCLSLVSCHACDVCCVYMRVSASVRVCLRVYLMRLYLMYLMC